MTYTILGSSNQKLNKDKIKYDYFFWCVTDAIPKDRFAESHNIVRLKQCTTNRLIRPVLDFLAWCELYFVTKILKKQYKIIFKSSEGSHVHFINPIPFTDEKMIISEIQRREKEDNLNFAK